MAKTKGAQKAHRASLKKRVFNARRARTMKDSVKDFSKLVDAKKTKEAQEMLPKVYQALDKAAKRGIIKANNAARTKSRLSARLRKAA